METSNQFNPRCVCGGSTENPNADCERCQMLAELARLKSEKEAAERERDEARSQRDRLAGSLVGAIVDYDHQPYQVGDEDYERLCRRPEDGRYVLDAKAVDDIAQVEQWEEAVTWRTLVVDVVLRFHEELTAATSRAEALEKERGARADAVSEIIDCLRCVLLQPGNADYKQDARAAIKEYLALLQPAKEVAGGK